MHRRFNISPFSIIDDFIYQHFVNIFHFKKILKIRQEEKKKIIPQRAQSNGNVKSTAADEAFSRKRIEEEKIRGTPFGLDLNFFDA